MLLLYRMHFIHVFFIFFLLIVTLPTFWTTIKEELFCLLLHQISGDTSTWIRFFCKACWFGLIKGLCCNLVTPTFFSVTCEKLKLSITARFFIYSISFVLISIHPINEYLSCSTVIFVRNLLSLTVWKYGFLVFV